MLLQVYFIGVVINANLFYMDQAYKCVTLLDLKRLTNGVADRPT